MQCDILYDFKTFKILEFISKKNIFQLCECFSIDCILHWYLKSVLNSIWDLKCVD
jgi:hypothetical protein